MGSMSFMIVEILDWIFNSFFNIGEGIFDITKDAFNLTAVDKNITLFPINGITDNNNKICISFVYIRYFITIATPPVGVFMSKGLRGLFNILLTVLFCYVHYFIGIIYAFVICYNSPYADAYDAHVKEKNKIPDEEDSDDKELITKFSVFMAFVFICVFIYVIMYVL